MKKKIIALISGAVILIIAAGSIYGKSESGHKEGEPDVVGTFSVNRDENITVVANRGHIGDKEAFARELLQMYKDDSFYRIRTRICTGAEIIRDRYKDFSERGKGISIIWTCGLWRLWGNDDQTGCSGRRKGICLLYLFQTCGYESVCSTQNTNGQTRRNSIGTGKNPY